MDRGRLFAIAWGCFDPDQLKKQFGPRWAWIHYERITAMPIARYPTALARRVFGLDPAPPKRPEPKARQIEMFPLDFLATPFWAMPKRCSQPFRGFRVVKS